MWDKIDYPFTSSHCAAREVWEWKSNAILHFTVCMITFTHREKKSIHVNKRASFQVKYYMVLQPSVCICRNCPGKSKHLN